MVVVTEEKVDGMEVEGGGISVDVKDMSVDA